MGRDDGDARRERGATRGGGDAVDARVRRCARGRGASAIGGVEVCGARAGASSTASGCADDGCFAAGRRRRVDRGVRGARFDERIELNQATGGGRVCGAVTRGASASSDAPRRRTHAAKRGSHALSPTFFVGVTLHSAPDLPGMLPLTMMQSFSTDMTVKPFTVTISSPMCPCMRLPG